MQPLHIVIAPDESGGFTVHVPDLPGCISHGATVDAALANIREAMSLYLDGETPESLRRAGVRQEVIDTVLAVAA